MESTSVHALVATLHHADLRVRVGLWLHPLSLLGAEADEAARLMLQAVDLRAELLNRLPPGAAYARIDAGNTLSLLDDLSQRSYFGGCALVYNLDLLLAALTLRERSNLWSFLFTDLPWRKSALLLTLPVTATRLMPAETVSDQWRAANRLVITV